MYVGNDFDPAAPAETRRYTFDFSNDIPAAESITSSDWIIEVRNGVDPTPMTHLSGPSTVSGKMVMQNIGGLLAGVTYVVRCLATTSVQGPIELHSHVRCEAAK